MFDEMQKEISDYEENKSGGEKMKLPVRELIKIPNGEHTGIIVKIDYKKEPYEYTDITIKPDKFDVDLRYGCPTYVSTDSKLGKLLGKWVEVTPKEELDPDEILIGKKVKFMTLMETVKDKETGDTREYARIVDGSITPLNAKKK